MLLSSISVVLASSSIAFARLSSDLPRVSIRQGTLVGKLTRINTQFYGNIPFAEPPVGNLRFRRPAALQKELDGSSEEYDAREFGQFCLQPDAYPGIGSEDCLFVNVWKPAGATNSSNLSVFAYIHGGGYNFGAPISAKMSNFVEQSQNVVSVSIGYRLGAPGFLSSKDIVADGDSNAGLWDQREALRWIQRNIAQFGGNPGDVTIAGESAGAGSVLYQMFANGGDSEGLFHAAILQSIATSSLTTVEESEPYYRTAGKAAGCDNSTTILDCLRNSSDTAIRLATSAVILAHDIAPLFDDYFIPDIPSKLISAGKFARVPMILGHIASEAYGSIPLTFRNTTDGFWEDFESAFAIRSTNFTLTEETKTRFAKLYPEPEASEGEYELQSERAEIALSDSWLSCLDSHLANASATLGGNANTSWLYRWDVPEAVREPAKSLGVAIHAAEIFFLFDAHNYADGTSSGPTLQYTASEKAVSDESMAYWSSFTRGTNANGTVGRSPSAFKLGGSPVWEPAGAALGRLVIKPNGETVMEANPEKHLERCKFWVETEIADQLRL